jgi:DNA-directed RNA polymerase subunit N (RpoN/RPB10)
MLKLYLYGYFNGISSSRKLEVETHRNKEAIWLMKGLQPDHWTISNYRKDNGEDIKYVTKQFREFLKEKGYIKLEKVAIDGSKVKAYTNREMLTIEKIEEKLIDIDKKVEEYLKQIKEKDEVDEVLEEVGEGNNKSYIEKIIELKKQVAELKRMQGILESEDRKYISPNDVEARLMKSRDGKIPAYNVQIAVDNEHKMITDSEVVTDETDLGQLPKMIESIKEELGEAPQEALADSGYNTPDLIEALEKQEEGTKVYVSQQKTTRDTEEIKFEYDEERDEYKCSEGKRLILIQKNKPRRKSLANVYRGIECEGCPKRNQYTSSKKGRLVHRYQNQKWRDEYKEKMQSELGRSKMSLRRQLVEHPFGTIKYLMGKIPLKLRGKEKVSTEINLYTTVYNLKRLINIESYEKIYEQIEGYAWKTA